MLLAWLATMALVAHLSALPPASPARRPSHRPLTRRVPPIARRRPTVVIELAVPIDVAVPVPVALPCAVCGAEPLARPQRTVDGGRGEGDGELSGIVARCGYAVRWGRA